MPTIRDWTLPGAGANGQPILGSVHLPDPSPVGVALLCHGFKGYKDYGFFPQLAQSLAARGVIAHRFNFSHSGMTNRIETFERPDLFAADRWSKQVLDLHAVAAAVRDGRLDGASLPMTWFGHSRGGVTVLLAADRAARDKHACQPDRLVVAAAPHRACNFDDATREVMRKQGYLDSPSNRTGQNLRVGRAWLDEIEADPDAFDPVLAAGRVTCPLLIIHGDDDATVPVDAARAIGDAAGSHGRVTILSGANHTFNAPNPLSLDAAPPAATAMFIDAVCDFVCE